MILLVGCYSNNAGRLPLDGLGPDGGFAGNDGGGFAGDGGGSGAGGAGGPGGGGAGGAGGTAASAGSGGSGGDPLTGTWQPPVTISSHGGFAVNPHVSIGANNEVVSVWVQSDLGAFHVWANRYVSPGGWETNSMIGTTDGSVSDLSKTSKPDVVVDSSGVATAAWADFPNPIVRGLVSRRYESPAGWGDTETIYAGNSTAGDARLSVDASGNVMAVFATGTGAWANYREPTLPWAGPVIIDNEPNQPDGVQVALEPAGDAWAAWSQAPTLINYNIYGNQFVAGADWGDAGRVENSAVGSALAPSLAVDSNGNALFVWHQTAALSFQVWSTRWDDAEGEFTNPVRLDTAGRATGAKVASDPQGNGTAVWIQSTQASGGTLQVAASRYTPANGWSDAETLAEGAITSTPRVAMDSQGNAVIVYTQLVPPEDQVDVWAHTFSGGLWSAAIGLGTEDRTGGSFQPSVAMSPSGKAVVVWREGPDILASSFE